MVRPVGSLAPGFQGLLGIKNMGELPSEQLDNVQPIIDMREFYLQGRRRALSVATTAVSGASIGAIAPASAVTVPANKTWVILGGSVGLSIAAAQVLSISAFVYAATTLAPNSSVIVLSETITVGSPNVAAAAILGSGVGITVPMIPGVVLQAGDNVNYYVNFANGAGAGAIALNIIYAEIDS